MLFAIGLSGGCSDANEVPKIDAITKHEHHAPHGGTPVDLGEEEYHVELLVDTTTGKLQAYVLDGEMENFVRIPAQSFVITVRQPDKNTLLILKAVPNRATGETLGDACLFEAQADWLKTTPVFDAILNEIAVRGRSYSNIIFNIPKGNAPRH